MGHSRGIVRPGGSDRIARTLFARKGGRQVEGSSHRSYMGRQALVGGSGGTTIGKGAAFAASVA